MGAQLTRPAGPLNCEVMVNDRSGDRIHRIDLVLDGKQVVSVRPGTMQYAWSVPVDFPKGKHYLYARVYQTDKEKAADRISYSAPVWVNAW